MKDSTCQRKPRIIQQRWQKHYDDAIKRQKCAPPIKNGKTNAKTTRKRKDAPVAQQQSHWVEINCLIPAVKNLC